MYTYEKLIILITLQVLASCSTITVNSGDTANLEWQITDNVVEIHFNKNTYLATVSGNTITLIREAVDNKYGNRFTVERNGNAIKVIIKDARSSDEGEYTIYRRAGMNFVPLETRTLVVEGLSSSEQTGLIVGLVVAAILIFIIIGIVIYCYKRKKRQQETGEESATPMNQTNQESLNKAETNPEEHHYDQFQPPDKKENTTMSPVVYSELGPGGRMGPKDPVGTSNYATAKY